MLYTLSFAQQRGLAKAGRGGHEGQFAVQPRVQPFDQARARHPPCPELVEGNQRGYDVFH